ncbi:MAG TPA: PQQ-dependent sugar dehydrogenase [Ramlibacter sp.]|jgi:glucose/arabinose dehydrogenase|uniref:PQQ-dependent sugar dehydrogenase n=1 Tax=Ramlibacter sp. TaxID=1917967 RepID=UPI002D5E14B8|nr:PQQ-dependent sugar dehydrogenase [Ramlibacter sp.]HZY18683.1 PQQ-dependent sugar dehydrogenase [Ramlibacter sp.]
MGWTLARLGLGRLGWLVLALAASLAPLAGTAQQVRAEAVASGLAHPWAVAFLEGGRFLVSEREGRLRVVEPDGRIGPPVAGVPQVASGGQGGLLDVVLDSGFAERRTVFFCFSEPGAGGSTTALARARLSPDRARLEDVRVIFRQQPRVASQLHFGCRIVEAPDGHLFLTLGERFTRRQDAQRLDNHLGKVVRVTKDGAAAPGNPFVGRPGALPEIWSLGHRNGQGATIGPGQRLWMHEHGPQGGDEINLPEAGRNYGWPVITHGENYGGGPIGEGLTAKAGLEQPVHFWVPSIAPSGMAFLTSDRYGPALRGNLFVGSLKFTHLARLELADGKVVREQRLLEGVGRVRDVRQGPDGLLYLLTDAPDGRLLRLLPR